MLNIIIKTQTNGKKNAVLRDVAPIRSCQNRRFGGTCRLHLQGGKNSTASNVSNNKQTEPQFEETLKWTGEWDTWEVGEGGGGYV
jgi:hypothetical protein